MANFEIKYSEDKIYCLSYTSADGCFPDDEEEIGRRWQRTPGDHDHFCSDTITKPDAEMYVAVE